MGETRPPTHRELLQYAFYGRKLKADEVEEAEKLDLALSLSIGCARQSDLVGPNDYFIGMVRTQGARHSVVTISYRTTFP